MMGKLCKLFGLIAALPAALVDGHMKHLATHCFVQSDFDHGTFVIRRPGEYRLCENISFKPNPPRDGVSPTEAFQPVYGGGGYDMFNYGLGFFAAIAITVDGVELHLDGFTIEQSKEHALMQRFFAVIELARSPFLKGAGPAEFIGDQGSFVAAHDVKILGPGTIGLSAHHGIHGNDNSNILIDGVTFVDFEVAAVSLNNVDGLVIKNCDIPRNRHDAPVLGMFSGAVFIRPYGKWLHENHPNKVFSLGGVDKTSTELFKALDESINNAYDAVINGNGSLDPLYNNTKRICDGPCYAFLIHGRGPAVEDFGFALHEDEEQTSSDIEIVNNNISGIKCWNVEVPAAVINDTVQTDARGAVFQFVNTVTGDGIAITPEGTYKSNVVADMQLAVASAIHDGTMKNFITLQINSNTIHPELVEWASSATATYEPRYRCNGDAMHHVIKGIAVIRIDDTLGFTLKNNSITDIENLSVDAFPDCADVHIGASEENEGMQCMGDVRIISVAACRGFQPEKKTPLSDAKRFSEIVGNVIENAMSTVGERVIGVDIQGDTEQLNLLGNHVDLQEGNPPVMGNLELALNNLKKFVGVRVRENCEAASISIDRDNFFIDGIVEENKHRVRRVRRSLVNPQQHRQLEWQNGAGGCPFARLFQARGGQ